MTRPRPSRKGDPALSAEDERVIVFVAVMLASWTREAGGDTSAIVSHGRKVMRQILRAEKSTRSAGEGSIRKGDAR